MDDFACHVLKRATARNWAIERKARHVIAKRLTFFHRPMLDDVPRGIKRCVFIEEASPERVQGANATTRADIRAAHLKKAREAQSRESVGEIVDHVSHYLTFP